VASRIETGITTTLKLALLGLLDNTLFMCLLRDLGSKEFDVHPICAESLLKPLLHEFLGCDETLVGNIIAPVVSNIVAIDPSFKLSQNSQLAGTNRT
jgi:hypothetical protein